MKRPRVFSLNAVNLVTLILLAMGCGSLQQYDTVANYKMTLPVSVNGNLISGGGSVPFSDSYELHVFNSKKIDFLHISSCARSIDVEEPFFKKRIMKNKTEYHFKYKPLPHEIGCNLEFIVADKDGENKVGLLVFQEGINGVQAVVGCNGSSSVMESNGFCQSKFGLYQSLKFYKEVVSANEENCPKGKGKNWLFEMPLGSNECVFMELESKEMFTLQTYGWDRILLEKE